MIDFNERTAMILGDEAVQKIKKMHVAVFGLGGVGGSACEALVRAGVFELTLVDADTVDVSNINRQAFATSETIGFDKIEAASIRLKAINPNVILHTKKVFYLPENRDEFDFSVYDYVVDAIDTVSAKISLVEEASRSNTPIISAMGAGNKLDPTRFEVADIYKTSVCPLAKVMRKELKQRGIQSLKVVYSKEEPVTNKRPPGSVSFVPPVVGIIMAGEVIKDAIK